ncbi:hypothetical protein QOZ80_5BG0442330 [Eleusine coracana subsp. coracana]|nr:hypothetical protein QOZ80_5BG0442330 [Eleusine coracana subsp. coracana]
MCLERISATAYFSMASHPDGSGRVFVSTPDGKISLASVPATGTGAILRAIPFLDLTDQVVRLMGVAFHPEFATNGRFFVSYNCDSSTSPTCIRSAASGNGSSPFQYQLVVAEFSADSTVTRANPSEVRRIFTMGLPQQYTSYTYPQQHGSQILFHPSDGFLYLIIGNGEIEERHFDFAKNISCLRKIIRFQIDSISGQSGGANNRTNRSGSLTAEIEAEIFATGLNDPRGCNFDSESPSYIYCANVNEQQVESIYLISKGGNCSGSPDNATFLIVGYGSPVPGSNTKPSIIGGLVYRGSADPSLKGRYLYVYGFNVWAAVETPMSSGRYASALISNIMCSESTPLPCTGGGIGGQVISWGEDNDKDAYILATGGAPSRSSSGLAWRLSTIAGSLAILISIFWKLFMAKQPVTNCSGWFGCCASNSVSCWCCNIYN